MAKRLTDSEKWSHSWFRQLPPKMKCAWFYLLDQCDHAGIWNIDMETMSYFIGEKISLEDLKKSFQEKVSLIGEDKLYLNGYIKFQYSCDVSQLNDNNKVHRSAIIILLKYGLIDRQAPTKPHASPMLGAKDKDKDKGKEKEMDKEKNKDTFPISNNDSKRFEDRFLNQDEHGRIQSLLEVVFENNIPPNIRLSIPEFLRKHESVEKFKQNLEDIWNSAKADKTKNDNWRNYISGALMKQAGVR